MSTPYADADNTAPRRSRPPLAAVLASPPHLLLWGPRSVSLVAGFVDDVAVRNDTRTHLRAVR